MIGFPLPYGKPLLFERLSFKFWTENCCCPNRRFFLHGWLNIFLWKDNPSSSNGIPTDLERMTNSKRLSFSHLNRYLLVYVFVREIITKKSLKTKTYSNVEDLMSIQECMSTLLSQHDVTSKHDWRVKFLAGQFNILVGPSCYFEPDVWCNRHVLTSNSVDGSSFFVIELCTWIRALWEKDCEYTE